LLEAILETTDAEATVDLGNCLSIYAEVLMLQGAPVRAREMARRSVAIQRTLGDSTLANALTVLANLETALGDKRAARGALEEAVECARDFGDTWELGETLHALASLDMDEENWEHALELLQEARMLYLAGGEDYSVGYVNHYVAVVLRKLGRTKEAHELMSAHLWQWMRHESFLNLAYYAEDYSAVLAQVGFARFAPLVLGASDAERQRQGVPRDHRQETQVAEAYAAALPTMTPTEWATVRERGRGMTLRDALLEAISSTTDLRA
jgi:tetratricopeptide (TPR) repeat protein